MENILTMDNLSFTYDKKKFVLKDINMNFTPGVLYGIFGRSGAGKSTLLSLLAGLETTTYGNIYYKGNPLNKMNLDKYRCNEIGIIFQAYNLLPQLTAIENVILSMDISNLKVNDREKKAKALLKKVGLSDELINRRVLQLSGGEQQRVALARAIVNNPSMLIADEPTGNLDPNTAWDIMGLLNDINLRGTTVVVATHAKEIVDKMNKRVIRVDHGNIIRDEKGGYDGEK